MMHGDQDALWVDPTPVVRYVLAHCRVAQETRDPGVAAEQHALCERRIERLWSVGPRLEVCRCPCHHGEGET